MPHKNMLRESTPRKNALRKKASGKKALQKNTLHKDTPRKKTPSRKRPPDISAERIKKGLSVLEEYHGTIPTESNTLGLCREPILGQSYAEIWSRPDLNLRDRAMITVVVLLVTGHEEELRVHLRGLAHQKVSREQALEMMLHIGVYAGWPTALAGQRAVNEVYNGLDLP